MTGDQSDARVEIPYDRSEQVLSLIDELENREKLIRKLQQENKLLLLRNVALSKENENLLIKDK